MGLPMSNQECYWELCYEYAEYATRNKYELPFGGMKPVPHHIYLCRVHAAICVIEINNDGYHLRLVSVPKTSVTI